jgi:hypothetical protein
MKKHFILAVTFIYIVCLVFCPAVHAETPDELQLKAQDNLHLAREFAVRAQEVLKKKNTLENVTVAIYLFTEAGMLYEESAKILDYLAPEYAFPSDAKGAIDAMKQCQGAVQKCVGRKNMLSKGRMKF